MKRILFVLCALSYCSSLSAKNQGEFELAQRHVLVVDKAEKAVVHTAVEIFERDLMAVLFEKSPKRSSKIIAGTLGVSSSVDSVVKKQRINVKDMLNAWEAFKIVAIDPSTLVVIGSDARGSAYGILELSRMLGVSPWEWWADVTVQKSPSVQLAVGVVSAQRPSVQYRGIFLNDEDWGLVPWSSTQFEPIGIENSIGPKTYSKIFELLLRLRANTIWPAMHEETTPFYTIQGNQQAADRYGIVVGTSHCEPMMRNNAGEWSKANLGRYNFQTNRQNIINYWAERLEQVAGTEIFVTVGTRGVHDGRMEGVGTTTEYRNALHHVFNVQKELLERYINPVVAKIPQAMVLYKEVLAVYKDSLRVPDYVTLMWADDNYGYITNLSNSQEQKRSGGSGIYYHLSYWGSPHDYLWLSSTPPALIYTQMKRAWDHGARKLWIVNVGDIKPAEYNTEFFLDLAWDINAVNRTDIPAHLYRWAAREFGVEHAAQIAKIMNEYYRLAAIRKPEHLGFNRVEVGGYPNDGHMPVAATTWTKSEVAARVEQYDMLEQQVLALSPQIAPDRSDAFFELVSYPIRGAALMNKKWLTTGQSAWSAYRELVRLTNHYNHVLASGKWRGIMDIAPRGLPVFAPPINSHKDSVVGIADPSFVLEFMGADFTPASAVNAVVIPGLGQSYRAAEIQPQKTVEYPLVLPQKGVYTLDIGFLPMHPATGGDIRVRVSIDETELGVFPINTKPFTDPWRYNVAQNQSVVSSVFDFEANTTYVLRLEALDRDVVVDKIRIRL